MSSKASRRTTSTTASKSDNATTLRGLSSSSKSAVRPEEEEEEEECEEGEEDKKQQSVNACARVSCGSSKQGAVERRHTDRQRRGCPTLRCDLVHKRHHVIIRLMERCQVTAALCNQRAHELTAKADKPLSKLLLRHHHVRRFPNAVQPREKVCPVCTPGLLRAVCPARHVAPQCQLPRTLIQRWTTGGGGGGTGDSGLFVCSVLLVVAVCCFCLGSTVGGVWLSALRVMAAASSSSLLLLLLLSVAAGPRAGR